ncbi:polyubiquitin [Tanacetum coccineum]
MQADTGLSRTKTISLQVETYDTINSVKSKIQSQEDTPYEQQRLFLPQIQLRDDCTLADYYIQNDSTLHLVVTLIKIFIKTTHRDIIALHVDGSDNISNMKTKIQYKENIPRICQIFFLVSGRRARAESEQFNPCQMPCTESTLHLSVTPDKTCVDAISNVKAAIPANNHLNA